MAQKARDETRLDRALCPPPTNANGGNGRRESEGLRLVKAGPVFVTLLAQCILVVIALVTMYNNGQQNAKDIAEVKATVAAVSAQITLQSGPNAVNTAKIAALESQSQQSASRIDQIRNDITQMRIDILRRIK